MRRQQTDLMRHSVPNKGGELSGSSNASGSPSAAPDRRVARTRRNLRSALLNLIYDQDYDTITVQQILDKADVGRSTFYAHFRNKEDCLLGGIRRGLLTWWLDAGMPYSPAEMDRFLARLIDK